MIHLGYFVEAENIIGSDKIAGVKLRYTGTNLSSSAESIYLIKIRSSDHQPLPKLM